ncbi:MAG: hypothetical protein NC321_10880 [Clostridium sp.]|nr:hypothetical protein [Clostridium sp.]
MKNSEIYKDLSMEKYLDCICDIPSKQILQDFKSEFAKWECSDDSDFENGDEAFQLLITKQFVRADCYSMTEKNMNKIIDIMLKYDCPLYDAAIDVRFDEE